MAYGRRYWRRYYRRYYRNRYNSSYGKTRMTRNFKSSALNMTQGGTFNISCHLDQNHQFTSTALEFVFGLDVGAAIKNSNMHKALSNVFDQYRVEKCTIRIRPVGDSTGTVINPAILFSCLDRSGFSQNATLAELRTYGSYKETQITGAKDVSPTHNIYIGATNLVEFTTYHDTKNKAAFPSIAWGAAFAALSGNVTAYFSIEMDCQIRYRGVRYDPSQVV